MLDARSTPESVTTRGSDQKASQPKHWWLLLDLEAVSHYVYIDVYNTFMYIYINIYILISILYIYHITGSLRVLLHLVTNPATKEKAWKCRQVGRLCRACQWRGGATMQDGIYPLPQKFENETRTKIWRKSIWWKINLFVNPEIFCWGYVGEVAICGACEFWDFAPVACGKWASSVWFLQDATWNLTKGYQQTMLLGRWKLLSDLVVSSIHVKFQGCNWSEGHGKA